MFLGKKTKKLIEAAKEGDQNAVQALLDKGADVNAKDGYGKTAWMYAAKRDHTETIELLIKYGAKK